jgi:predicted amidohydrolase YtcJ
MGRVLGRSGFLLCAITLLFAADVQLEAQTGQDHIFFNAKIFTADPQNPYAEAVAIRGDKILAVGNLSEVSKAAPNAARTDLDGKSLFPGFIDSHSHTIDGGLNLIAADATEKVDSIQDLPAFVDEAKKSGRGMRGDIVEILGLPLEFWSHTDFLNDQLSAGTYSNQSVILRGMDGHTSWANRAMLQRAGITAEYLKSLTPDQRSYYGVDKNMQPTGFLVDAGQDKVDRLMPPPTDKELRDAAHAALEYNYSLGITAWLEPSAPESSLKAYKMLSDRGELNSEIAAFPKVLAKDPPAELDFVHKRQQTYGIIPHLHITGIKIFADGVAEFPSQTAHLTKPYKNSGRNGELLFDQKSFNQLCISADKAGLIIHVHAIGDGAVKAALDGIAAARAANGDSHLPHTLTHEQFIRPEDFPRFRELGVISAMQLFWADAGNDTIEILKPYVDASVYKWQYPARSVLDNGGIISGASDWPVSTANVFRAIYQAETRKGKEGVLDASQAMPREAMFYAYTRNSARALNLDSIGRIAPGKRADLIVLDRDVFTVSPEEMRDTKVLWTMVAGKTVYRAK